MYNIIPRASEQTDFGRWSRFLTVRKTPLSNLDMTPSWRCFLCVSKWFRVRILARIFFKVLQISNCTQQQESDHIYIYVTFELRLFFVEVNTCLWQYSGWSNFTLFRSCLSRAAKNLACVFLTKVWSSGRDSTWGVWVACDETSGGGWGTGCLPLRQGGGNLSQAPP